MQECVQCGMKFSEEFQFCPKCGTPVKPETPADKAGDPGNLDKTIHRATPGYGALFLDNLPQGYVIEERYEIKSKIGQGGFGAVYLAYDRKMEIEKALKVIPEAIVHDVEAMESLRREARTMIRLNHPHIVRVYDFHDSGAIKFIDMEYVSGESLSALKVKQPDKRFSEAQVKVYAIQIAEALAYAHGQGVIHRDIKPQNIMVTEAGEVKIMDFGIAETVRTSMSRIANVFSSETLLYMSPEQLRGKEIGKESDIYSFGVTLYELLCGHPPFYQGNITEKILHNSLEPIEGISEELKRILQKCMAKDPSERFESFEEIQKVFGGEETILKDALERPQEKTSIENNAEQSKEIVVSVQKKFPASKKKNLRLVDIQKHLLRHWKLDAIVLGVVFLIIMLSYFAEERKQKRIAEEIYTSIDWVWVPGGSFLMGSDEGNDDEKPSHIVTVDGFYLSKYEVTFNLYDKFCEATGRSKPDDEGWGRGNRPAINVSWNDAVAFCEWLSKKTGTAIRLPTEAEWEYAARGGSRSMGFMYSGSDDPDQVSWYNENSDNQTHPVGQKDPNELGLYDMSGNVWEWCLDRYDRNYYEYSPSNNPFGPVEGVFRLFRGGSWYFGTDRLRSTFRNYSRPERSYSSVGFRVLMEGEN